MPVILSVRSEESRNRTVVLRVIFFRNHRAVFIEAAPFSIPTGRARGFQFFHILAHTDVLLSFFVLAT